MESGDKITLETKKESITGFLMPNSDEKTLVLKLSNGYNIGVNRNSIVKTKVLEKVKTQKAAKTAVKGKKGLKKIVILHTGGTIASKVDYKTGGVIAGFSADDLLSMFPELGEIANIETELVSNMMSEDMNFLDYQKIAFAVKKHASKGADGIIIGHGTDTLTFTAAALAFMFEKINIPVLVVGSQRSSDRGSTDAAMNMICAAEFIAQTDFVGVAICMHHSSDDEKCVILPATKTRKMHTSRRDAFKAINDIPFALIDYPTRKINFLKKNYPKKSSDNSILLKSKLDENVGMLRIHTNMKNSLFEFFTKNYKAFVFEATGIGHGPTNVGSNIKNYESLKKYIKKGGIVAVTSQCLYGRVHPYIYTNIRRLSGIGCIYCEDMLPETAFIKLAWLLGNYSNDEAIEMLNKNIRGEITERTTSENFLE